MLSLEGQTHVPREIRPSGMGRCPNNSAIEAGVLLSRTINHDPGPDGQSHSSSAALSSAFRSKLTDLHACLSVIIRNQIESLTRGHSLLPFMVVANSSTSVSCKRSTQSPKFAFVSDARCRIPASTHRGTLVRGQADGRPGLEPSVTKQILRLRTVLVRSVQSPQ